MAKKRAGKPPLQNGLDLLARTAQRRIRPLVLPRLLAAEADNMQYRGEKQERAFDILRKWAKLEEQGHLKRKETALDASFLLEVFGDALGYKPATASPDKYYLERNFTVPGVGTADGALGAFTPLPPLQPVAVIELKDADTDLDRDKFNGRTAVQQCWDYLNALPECPWGIVSNFISFRLYHRNKTQLAYQEFRLQDLVNLDVFRQFWCLFEFGALFSTPLGGPRALRLLAGSENRQREVGGQLYQTYSDNRYRLIEHLHFKMGKPLDQAIHIAQKIIDRIIFVAFCEDRGLLPERCIETAYSTLPPFTKVTNPRWRNFLDLFQAIDKGHNDLLLEVGYNGGLFRHDDDVDNLQLDDSWTTFFKTIGEYDFRYEVNVEVLGNLFERSISELEKLRQAALFTPTASDPDEPAPTMPKSPERKRFGIFYTPLDFTGYIVQNTVGSLVKERWLDIRQRLGVDPKVLESDEPNPAAKRFWQECFENLKQIKILDPACGSGAFLIQAYDLLEDRFVAVVEQLVFHDGVAAETLFDQIPDLILSENLFGVDLSEQGVEITQLALWLRSARRGRTLADLSHNILRGNSLVSDPAVHPLALDWDNAFPAVFARPQAGFDCVVGNPPWERLKLQEREFFAFSAPKIAGAVNAARRRQLIDKLGANNPELFARYTRAKDDAEKTLAHVRASGQFPMTGKGDVNTYMLFAELARKLVAPNGRVGLLVPSGIATDHTTREFFGTLMNTNALISLHDFENKAPVFPDVHRSFKFCTFIFGGATVKSPQADFVFFARYMDELENSGRHIALSNKDIALLNPNTRTCPIFRSQRDAELTKAIYRRVPVLIDESRKEGGNPWGAKFVRMFDQTNDAELFHSEKKLKDMGFKQEGNLWTKGKRRFLPLYEAKMVQAYDHRAASVIIEKANWMRQGQTDATSLVDHQNPEFVVQPRWWVEETEVERVLRKTQDRGFLGFKDITSPTNERTIIASFIPWSAVTNHFPLILTSADLRLEACLLANLNSFVLDYVTRQKIGGVTLNFFIVEQLPIFPPDHYAERCPWDKRQTLEKWISERVLKLTCTANDMKPLAHASGMDPLVHKWRATDRAQLLAELDAAFFHLYGISRKDMEYILGTFADKSEADEAAGLFAPARRIYEAYESIIQTA